MKNSYKKMQRTAKRYNEKRDCAVRAVTAISNLPYTYVHQVFTDCGRKRRRGTPVLIVGKVLDKLNILLERHTFEAKTIASLTRELPRKGRFLIQTNGHMLAVVDGEVIDFTKGRRYRIQQAYKVSF